MMLDHSKIAEILMPRLIAGARAKTTWKVAAASMKDSGKTD
jgi:hypothetical protein